MAKWKYRLSLVGAATSNNGLGGQSRGNVYLNMGFQGYREGPPQDTNNDEESLNYAIPLSMPSKRGNLWIEPSPGDVLRGPILERKYDRGRPRYGQVLPPGKGEVQ